MEALQEVVFSLREDTEHSVPSVQWLTSCETLTTGKERWAFLPPVESVLRTLLYEDVT